MNPPLSSNGVARSRGFWLTMVLYCVLMIGSSGAGPETEWTPPIPFLDKWAHFLVYGLLATGVARIMPAGSSRPRIFWRTLLVVAAAGALEEGRQSINPLRDASWWDWLADWAGAVMATALYQHWRRWRLFWETSVRFSWRRFFSKRSLLRATLSNGAEAGSEVPDRTAVLPCPAGSD